MSSKEKNFVKMQVTEELTDKIIGEVNGWLKVCRCELEGRLLTTAEAAMEDGTRLTAFKRRIKDVIGDAWESIHNTDIEIFDQYFSRQEEPGESSEDEKIFFDFIECLAYAVQTRVHQLRVTLAPIIRIALGEAASPVPVKVEFDRLIGRTSSRLTRAIGRGLREVFAKRK